MGYQQTSNLTITEIPMSEIEAASEFPLDKIPAFGVEDHLDDPFRVEALLQSLTKRQREVAELLGQGYCRQEIADTLHIGIQAVYQIVIRIRYRLVRKAEVKANERYK